MSKFKIGDEVERVSGGTWLGMKEGDRGIIMGIAALGSLELEGYSVLYDGANYKLANPKYPNPPHKHAELIKAWADGAEIEFYSSMCGGQWIRETDFHTWNKELKYRIKPNKSDKDIQIEQLEKEARELADKIAKLKG